jgi:hypothetical protein
MRVVSRRKPSMTVGIDLGDKYSFLCLVDTESGEVIEEGRLPTTPEALCALAPPVGERGGLRPTLQCPSVPRAEGGGLNRGYGSDHQRGGEDSATAARRPYKVADGHS